MAQIRLSAEQQAGSEPERHIWLSASAGTGKTSVLSARVLRLLLRGVRPDAILCLTFTKAGATEMAERVHTTLARWVRADEATLFRELEALGEAVGPDARDTARRLFAHVLEARGGGLRIMTIHSFCQMLLASFPLEAGLAPGFRAVEGREAAALERQVLADMIVAAERNQPQLIADLRALSIRMGEDAVLGWLRQTAGALDVLEELAPGVEAKVRAGLGVPLDFRASDVVAACADGAFDRAALIELARMQTEWGTATGEKAADRIGEWLLGTAEERAAELGDLRLVWATKEGTLRKTGPRDAGYPALVARVDAWASDLIMRAERGRLADEVSAAMRAALSYARAYAEAKRVRGLVDFDDLIARASDLLSEGGIGDWIRYKLDSATDHILVDEAQDTNADQWAIVEALAEEYWAGAGAKDGVLRTLFAVGDFKQAIFGFQGTDPRYYERAGLQFELKALQAGDALHRLSLTQSFRSTPPVLAVVDAVLDDLGAEAVGIADAFEPHVSHDAGGAGQVMLLPPVAPGSDADEAGEEDWARESERVLAGQIAGQLKAWMREGLRAGDVMILCRKRGELAALIVARLIEEGIAVAGVDRLRLQAPLVVQDMMAVVRFALQPRDDLNLAALLVSPLIGWTQDELYAVAQPRGKKLLWEAVPEGETREALLAMLRIADLTTPYRFLETILSGPLQGRAKLLARLGEEARDPLDELLQAALQFEAEGVAGLQGFADWFDRGEAEVKRDAGAAGDAVRVMTVHGAKGLQAPLVILADATKNPDNVIEKSLEWQLEGLSRALPMFRPRKAERQLCATLGAALDDAERRAREEHWRLLYVAMTRAERMLVVTGALGPRDRGVVPQASWHAAIGVSMMRIGAVRRDIEGWGEAIIWGGLSPSRLREGLGVGAPEGRWGSLRAPTPTPPVNGRGLDWLYRLAPTEAAPPRPLAPSSLGVDDDANPPPSAALFAAAERGRLLHALFERLPALPPLERRMVGKAWLGAIEGADALLEAALGVIEHPKCAPLFTTEGLAEAPIAGVVEGVVVAGTVDRLIVNANKVTIVDYKTGRRVPKTLEAIPRAHVRQMAAYAAVMTQIYPARTVETVLLYTEGPELHRLPQSLLDRHKPDYHGVQAKLIAGG